jgi:3-isopropylmalate/(R)-2-methylmalate dehydratase small subunit
MQPFVRHTGRALPLRRSNVDTDQIIPAVWLKNVGRTGFAPGLFAAWRADPDFALNQPAYGGATVLLAGPDFGTGSSREHAVWALQDYGFQAVLSPRFGDIFLGNAYKNGLLPVELAADTVEDLIAAVEADPALPVCVDLLRRQVSAGGITASFDVDDDTRSRLLEGLDDIAVTLRHTETITAYEAGRPDWMPTTVLG